jgi:hypothetical protein
MQAHGGAGEKKWKRGEREHDDLFMVESPGHHTMTKAEGHPRGLNEFCCSRL